MVMIFFDMEWGMRMVFWDLMQDMLMAALGTQDMVMLIF